jgi:hypothetical protein
VGISSTDHQAVVEEGAVEHQVQLAYCAEEVVEALILVV